MTSMEAYIKEKFFILVFFSFLFAACNVVSKSSVDDSFLQTEIEAFAFTNSITSYGTLFKSEETLTKTVIFINMGTQDIPNCSSAAFTGDTSHFSIISDSCGIKDLKRGTSCNFEIQAAPTAVGTFTATLSRTCNGSTESTQVQTTGVGLTVTAFSPVSGSTIHEPNSNLFAVFSHAISTFSLSGSNISLLDTNTGISFPTDFSYNSSSKTVTIDPKLPLPSSRSITMTVTTNITTTLGTALETETSNVITTGDAQVFTHGYATTYNSPSLRGTCSLTSTNLTATLNGAAAGVNIVYNDVDCSDGNFEITPDLSIAGNGSQTVTINVDSNSTTNTSSITITMNKCASFAAIAAFGAFDGGDGSIGDPYLISTRAQLNEVRSDVTKAYKLTADIDLSCYSFAPIGPSSFSGVFDGDGYAVSGFSLENDVATPRGFFGVIDDGLVKNFDLTDLFVEQTGGQPYIGGLTGRVIAGTGPAIVSNVLVTGRVISDTGYVGLVFGSSTTASHYFTDVWVSGFAETSANPSILSLFGGNNGDTTMQNIYVQGSLSGAKHIGGIGGYSAGGVVFKNGFCDVYVDTNDERVGGCFGTLINGTLSNVASKGIVLGANYIGGICGLTGQRPFFHRVSSESNVTTSGAVAGGISGKIMDSAVISHARSSGTVLNTGPFDYNGGISAIMSNVTMVLNSSSTSNISGGDNFNGGIAGLLLTGIIINNSYSTGTLSGNNNTGGIVGRIGDANTYVENSHYYGGDITSTLSAGGGITGLNWGTITNSYFLDGLCELGNGCDDTNGGVEYSAAQMSVEGNYSGWDFTSGRNWVLKSAANYPTLSFEDCTTYTEVTAATSFAGGDGTGGAPYQIETLAQLQFATTLPTSNFILNNNIDASGSCYSWTPFGSNAAPFTGVFNGNSKTVQGLFIENDSTDSGFFGSINGATVSDLSLHNFVTGLNNLRAGSLAGDANNSTITSVINYGHVVNAADDTGGLVGIAQNGTTITTSSNSGYVGSNSDDVGGLVGDCDNCTITNSTNSGNISGYDDVGGIVGQSSNTATISDVKNSGLIQGETSVGGGVGNLSAATDSITNGLSIGSVYGDTSSASFVADKDAGATVTDSFFLDTACGVGPPVGCAEASTAIGLTQANLILQASYPGGWNFTTIWEINNGVSYPNLR
ncbi:MAG: hypothetical protein HOE90_07475 [Bacteriovoracaceae bacterium]|jgi:hypothetical protein|nr:hypothetical protein [Bacteriovoracaceae bacterium]